jgi:hypothetical protein
VRHLFQNSDEFISSFEAASPNLTSPLAKSPKARISQLLNAKRQDRSRQASLDFGDGENFPPMEINSRNKDYFNRTMGDGEMRMHHISSRKPIKAAHKIGFNAPLVDNVLSKR